VPISANSTSLQNIICQCVTSRTCCSSVETGILDHDAELVREPLFAQTQSRKSPSAPSSPTPPPVRPALPPPRTRMHAAHRAPPRTQAIRHRHGRSSIRALVDRDIGEREASAQRDVLPDRAEAAAQGERRGAVQVQDGADSHPRGSLN